MTEEGCYPVGGFPNVWFPEAGSYQQFPGSFLDGRVTKTEPTKKVIRRNINILEYLEGVSENDIHGKTLRSIVPLMMCAYRYPSKKPEPQKGLWKEENKPADWDSELPGVPFRHPFFKACLPMKMVRQIFVYLRIKLLAIPEICRRLDKWKNSGTTYSSDDSCHKSNLAATGDSSDGSGSNSPQSSGDEDDDDDDVDRPTFLDTVRSIKQEISEPCEESEPLLVPKQEPIEPESDNETASFELESDLFQRMYSEIDNNTNSTAEENEMMGDYDSDPEPSKKKKKKKPRKKPKKKLIKPSQIFHCQVPECSSTFTSNGQLELHIKRYHTDTSNKPRCKECNKSFPDESLYKRHLTMAHSESKDFVCKKPFCFKTFSTQHGYQLHIKLHKQLNPHVCQVVGCDLSFIISKELDHHMDRAHPGKYKYGCVQEGCGRSYKSYCLLVKHVNEHRKNRKIICVESSCNKVFETRQGLKSHLVRHYDDDGLYGCAIEGCGLSKQLEGKALVTHIMKAHIQEFESCDSIRKKTQIEYVLTALDIKPEISTEMENPEEIPTEKPTGITCPNESCDLVFQNDRAVTGHLYHIHKQFACLVCRITFDSREDKKNHFSTIHSQTHFVNSGIQRRRAKSSIAQELCSLCGKQFKTPYYLKVHMRRHSDDRPYLCTICGAAFKDRKSHTTHLKIHNKVRGTYACPICQALLKSDESFLEHMSQHGAPVEGDLGKYSVERKYICHVPGCGKDFISNHGLTTHRWWQHRTKSCDRCQIAFESYYKLQKHNTQIHGFRKGTKKLGCSKKRASNHSSAIQKDYLCPQPGCDKVCSSQNMLKYHRQRFHVVHSCKLCKEVFPKRTILSEHRRVVHGLRAGDNRRYIECNVCGRSCRGWHDHGRHMLQHTGALPYSCSQCGKSFRYRHSARKHEESHGWMECAICNVVVTSHERLQEHVKTHIYLNGQPREYHENMDNEPYVYHENMRPVHN